MRTIVLILSLLAGASGAFSQEIRGTVSRVLEGDIVALSMGNNELLVRIADIDCPERGQDSFEEARRFTETTVCGNGVVVTVSGTQRGMMQGEVVTADGQSLGAAVVQAGLAWVEPASLNQTLHDLQEQARATHRGVWRSKNPVAPWKWNSSRPARVFRVQDSPALIVLILAGVMVLALKMLIGSKTRSKRAFKPLAAHIEEFLSRHFGKKGSPS